MISLAIWAHSAYYPKEESQGVEALQPLNIPLLKAKSVKLAKSQPVRFQSPTNWVSTEPWFIIDRETGVWNDPN